MLKAWKREHMFGVRSQSTLVPSVFVPLTRGMRLVSVFFVRVGSRISPPPGEQDQLNALPQRQQRQSNPDPMLCPPPPRRLNIDRCITLTPNRHNCRPHIKLPTHHNLVIVYENELTKLQGIRFL